MFLQTIDHTHHAIRDIFEDGPPTIKSYEISESCLKKKRTYTVHVHVYRPAPTHTHVYIHVQDSPTSKNAAISHFH